MLVHHAQAERVRRAWIVDRLFAAVDQDAARIRLVVTHDAFHQGALAGAVLAEERMERSGRHLQRHLVEGGELAETLGHRHRLDADRALGHRRRRQMEGVLGDLDGHAMVSISAPEFEPAPNTPPCILIILMAWSWLLLSVAPQQSSSRTHSKPRSLASRMVVCTQTSVVMPVSTMLSTPRVRSINSRSVAQNETLPGCWM